MVDLHEVFPNCTGWPKVSGMELVKVRGAAMAEGSQEPTTGWSAPLSIGARMKLLRIKTQNYSRTTKRNR